MNILNLIGWKSIIRIAVIGLDGSIEVVEIKNKISDVGLNMFRDALKGVITDAEIKYLAWGSDNTAVSGDHTTLVAEFDRKQVTLQESGATGIIVTTTYIAPYEGNESTIEELGWFAGADASATPDSGIMVARVLYSRAKTELESLQVERTDTLSEVV